MDIAKHKNLVSTRSPYLFVAVAGALLTVLAFLLVKELIHQRIEARFQSLSDTRINSLLREIKIAEAVVESQAILFSTADGIDRQQFSKFATPQLSRNRSLKALEWIPRVAANQRSHFESMAHDDGFPEFFIWELEGDQKAPVVLRANYYPVYYVEPMAGNQAAFGFDLASNPQRRDALDSAISSRGLTVTAPIKLVQETGAQWGALMLMPVFQTSLEGRENEGGEVSGFALAVFRIGELVNTAIQSSTQDVAGLHIHLLDTTDSSKPIPLFIEGLELSDSKEHVHGEFESLKSQRDIEVGGRRWSIELYVSDEFAAGESGWEILAVLVAGIATTLAILLYTRQQLVRTATIQEEVNRQTEILQASESRFRTLYEGTPIMLSSSDSDGRIVSVNAHWLAVLGYQYEEVVGLPVHDFMTEKSARYDREEIQAQLLSDGGVSNIPLHYVKKSGEVVDVVLHATAFYNDAGEFDYTLAALIDVTERNEIERGLRHAKARSESAEARLNQAIAAISDGFVYYDIDDRLAVCNDRYREIYAESADLLVVGNTFEKIVRTGAERGQYPEAIGRVDEWVAERMRRHRNPSGALEQELTSGRWVLIDERRTNDGGIVGIRTDITELKKRELQLTASEARYRHLYHKTPAMLHSIGADGRLIRVSDYWLSFFGYELADVIGHHLTEFMTEDSARYAREHAMPAFFAQGSIQNIEYQMLKKNGDIVDLLANAILTKDVEFESPRSITVLTDVTELKRAELELAQHRDNLKILVDERTRDLVQA
ncbi:MAG: CHASE domain-containing protein, partial [Pseudomonadota bacterium]